MSTGSTIHARTPADLEQARLRYYDRLAQHFQKQLSLGSIHTILEAGAGKGQLTIPLLDIQPTRVKLIAVDSSRGDYAGSFRILRSRLRKRGMTETLRLVTADVARLRKVADRSVDAVISNELLCDLKSEKTATRAFKEFHRILRPDGIMVHGEWMSIAANRAQELAIRADCSEGTDTPSRFWNPDELSGLMEASGFHRVQVTYFQTTMSMGAEAAMEELRNWGVRESFLKRNDKLLRRYGIELPFDHVVKSTKLA